MSSVSADCDHAVEEILHSVGDDGRYQKLFFWIFFVPSSFIIPWTVLVQIFQASIPDHWCHVSGKPINVTDELWKNMTIPWIEKDGKLMLSKCSQFDNIISFEDGSQQFEDSISITPCRHGWDFDTTYYDRTLPMDQNWVCDRDSYAARWLSAGLAGKVVGTVVFTCLADYCGRKLAMILTTQVYALFAIGRCFVTSEWGLLILMFLSCTPFPAIYEISLIWVMEVSGDIRARITTISFIMWTIGMCSLPLLAWLARDWVLLGIGTSIPFILYLGIWWIIPESPRWLISRGRVEESYKVFKTIARINGKKCPDDLLKTLEKLAESARSDRKNTSILTSCSFIELLKYPTLRKRTLLLTWCFTCNVLLYYGIMYNTSNISGNEFLNFFYLSVCELPGNLLGWICSEKIGRKFSEAGFFLLVAVTAGVIIVLSASSPWVEVFILVICKSLVNVSFLVTYMQLAEILPTSHRASGSGFAAVVSAVIGISAPYIAYSGSYWFSLPYVILVFIGLTGAVAAMFLPETLGASLPQTIAEAERFLIDQPFWFSGWHAKEKYRQVDSEKVPETLNMSL